MKKIVAISILIWYPINLLSAHRSPNGHLNSNKQIVTGRQLSSAQAKQNVVTHKNLSDQLRFLQWKQDRMEEQLKASLNLLTQIKNIVIPILRNQQCAAEFSTPSVCQQQSAQQVHAVSQTAGTTYSGPFAMHNGNSASAAVPYQTPTVQTNYPFVDPVALLNATAYTQVYIPQPILQPTAQPVFTQQAGVPLHQYTATETESDCNEVLTGESRFLQLVAEWNQPRAQEREECKKEKQQ